MRLLLLIYAAMLYKVPTFILEIDMTIFLKDELNTFMLTNQNIRAFRHFAIRISN